MNIKNEIVRDSEFLYKFEPSVLHQRHLGTSASMDLYVLARPGNKWIIFSQNIWPEFLCLNVEFDESQISEKNTRSQEKVG